MASLSFPSEAMSILEESALAGVISGNPGDLVLENLPLICLALRFKRCSFVLFLRLAATSVLLLGCRPHCAPMSIAMSTSF